MKSKNITLAGKKSQTDTGDIQVSQPANISITLYKSQITNFNTKTHRYLKKQTLTLHQPAHHKTQIWKNISSP